METQNKNIQESITNDTNKINTESSETLNSSLESKETESKEPIITEKESENKKETECDELVVTEKELKETEKNTTKKDSKTENTPKKGNRTILYIFLITAITMLAIYIIIGIFILKMYKTALEVLLISTPSLMVIANSMSEFASCL